MRAKFVLLLGLTMLFMAACDLDQVSVTGSGNIVSMDEDLSDFDSVDASRSFDVNIQQGESYSVVLRVDDNIQDDIVARVSGGTLELDLTRNIILRNATLEADITMPQLRAVDLSGSSDAKISGFSSDSLFSAGLSGSSSLSGDIDTGNIRLDLSGSSEVVLEGSGADLEADLSGSSDVDLSDFQVEDANLDLSGASQARVNVSGTIDVSASGSSDVTYLGSPTLGSISTSGSSSVSGE